LSDRFIDEAGLVKRVWEIEDLAALVETEELRAIENSELKRGKYKVKIQIDRSLRYIMLAQ
jgi:hypothetical protein